MTPLQPQEVFKKVGTKNGTMIYEPVTAFVLSPQELQREKEEYGRKFLNWIGGSGYADYIYSPQELLSLYNQHLNSKQ